MIKKLISIILCLTILISLSGCVLDSDIYIVYTSDVHCSLDTGMNYANVKAYKQHLKSSHSNVLLVDGGDFSQGGTVGDNSNGSAIIDLMNKTGYDVVTLGNHDFDYGLDSLKENLASAKFAVTSCNVDYIGEGDNPLKAVKPYVIKRCGLKKVAFIGIMTLDIVTDGKSSKGVYASDGNLLIDVHADPNNPDEQGDEVYEIIQNTINEARSKADYVVVISHLGNERNICLNSESLINFTSGIDVVLDAHDHVDKIETEWKNINDESVLYFGVGTNLSKIGLVTISTDGELSAEYVEYGEKDQTLQAKIDEYLDEYCY